MFESFEFKFILQFYFILEIKKDGGLHLKTCFNSIFKIFFTRKKLN